jgi:hypothetical protein
MERRNYAAQAFKKVSNIDGKVSAQTLAKHTSQRVAQ